jgi:hypothetical protein
VAYAPNPDGRKQAASDDGPAFQAGHAA